MKSHKLSSLLSDPIAERQQLITTDARYKEVITKRGLNYFDEYRNGRSTNEVSGKSIWMFIEMANWYAQNIEIEFGDPELIKANTLGQKGKTRFYDRELYAVTVIHPEQSNRPWINDNLDFDRKLVGYTTKYQMDKFLLYQPTLRGEFTLEKLDRLMKSQGYYRDKDSIYQAVYRFNYHKHKWPFFGEDPDSSADIVWLEAHLKPKNPREWTTHDDTSFRLPINALDFGRFFNIMTLPEFDYGKEWRMKGELCTSENKKKMLKKHLLSREQYKDQCREIYDVEIAEILQSEFKN